MTRLEEEELLAGVLSADAEQARTAEARVVRHAKEELREVSRRSTHQHDVLEAESTQAYLAAARAESDAQREARNAMEQIRRENEERRRGGVRETACRTAEHAPRGGGGWGCGYPTDPH